jgi:hypothetical protein
MSKVKTRLLKKKMKAGSAGVDVVGMIELVFSKNSKGCGIDVIKIKYFQYKEQISTYLTELRTISELIRGYEPACDIVNRSIIDHYNRYFAVTNENPVGEEEEDMFFANYDNFKSSQLLKYCTRLAGKISGSGINQNWKSIRAKARSGLLKLDIFNNIIENVSAPYDLSEYYHTSSRNTEENQNILTTSLRSLVNAGKKIYQLLKKPDVPMDRIFAMFKESLQSLKKGTRGINKLFDVIDKSEGIFEINFTKYYKNMVKDGNPYTMFTEFLTDVVSSSEVRDPTLVKECAILIRYLKNTINQMPRQHMDESNKITGIMDSILEVIEESSNLDSAPELSEDDIKKMINELESKFNVI